MTSGDDDIDEGSQPADSDPEASSGPATVRHPRTVPAIGEGGARSRDGDMLAALLDAGDHALETFRSEHMGAVSAASDEDLRRARHLLRALVSAVREGSGDRWRLVEAACDAIEMPHRPGNTERPPEMAEDSTSGQQAESDDGDRPTTPPAAPHLNGLGATWPEPHEAQQPAHLPTVGESAGAAAPGSVSFHELTDPTAVSWPPAQLQASAAPAAPALAAQHVSPAHAGYPDQGSAMEDRGEPPPPAWGQAYAPGSLPASAPQPLEPPPATPMAPAQPQAFAQSYDPASAVASDERAPTPPLFAPERAGPPPASSRTPVSALPFEDEQDRSPSWARTAPHTPAPSPSPPPAAATPHARDSGGGTAELTYGSAAHALALSLEEYAALCAARDLAPAGGAQEVERRYEIYDDRTRAAVDRAFELRLAREPAERARFQQIYREISAQLCHHAP